MQFQYTPYIWVLLASAAVSAATAGFAWGRRREPGATPFVVLCVTAVLWSLANGLEMAGADLPTKLFWANVQYLCYGIVPLAMLALALQHSGHGGWLTRRRLIGLSLVPAAAFVGVWTNPYHGLMRQNVYLDMAGAFSVVAKTYGPGFWIDAAYCYAVMWASALILLHAMLRATRPYRVQTAFLLLGLLLPLFWNSLYVVGLSPVPRFDFAPALLSLSGVLVGWGLFRYRLFDLVPVARDAVIEGISDGVMVLDTQRRIVDLNPAARRILGEPASWSAGQEVREALRAWPALAESCREANVGRAELWLGANGGAPCYDVRLSPLYDRHGSLVGQVVVLCDVTERWQMQSRLVEAERGLATMEERARIARELHDSLGQVLAFVNVQSQAARQLLATGQEGAADALLSRLLSVVQEAHADVRDYILGAKTGLPAEEGFVPALENCLQRFREMSGIRTTLSLPRKWEEAALSPDAEVQLLCIVQEALTNVRKHADAQLVRVQFDVYDGVAQVIVEDDGPRSGIGASDHAGAGPGDRGEPPG